MEQFFVTIAQISGSQKSKQIVDVDVSWTVTKGLITTGLISESDCTSVTITAGKKENEGDLSISETTTFQSLICFGNRRYIEIKHHPMKVTEETENPTEKSAFDVLMSISRRYDFLPDKRTERTEYDKLFNKVIDLLENEDVKFLSNSVDDLGKFVVSTLTSVLWYIDPHHEKFTSRGFEIPDCFSSFQGFYKWEIQHKKKPQLIAYELQEYLSSLVSVTTLPFFMNPKFSKFKTKMDTLARTFQQYINYLDKTKERNKVSKEKSTPVRSLNDNWSLNIIEKSDLNIDCSNYSELISQLEEVDFYVPIPTLEMEPIMKEERRVWYDHIKLPFSYAVYTHRFGNFLGNLIWIWKVFKEQDKRRPEENINVICKMRELIPVYSTRAMRKDLMSKYSKATKMKPAILRSIFKFVTNDEAAPESRKEGIIDQRIEFALHADDPELLQDLRALNGRPEDNKFDLFWKKLAKLLEEKCIVHERRHTDIGFLPFAISVRDLIDQVKKRLAEDCPIPSESWVRMNFQPTNPFIKSAINYTGRFDVKFKVQQRLLRAKHPDADYCLNLYGLMKSMAVQYRHISNFTCVDDKAIIPVGEPSNPISTGVRPHHRSLTTSGGNILALDHDYSVCGIVPSVLFHVEIPESETDSFYNGSVHVTVKEKVFEASSALRHVTENVKILRETSSEDNVSTEKPVLFIYSDGGPDHRTTFQSVQVSLVLLFILLDLDFLVAVRTAPCQSYNNPAERIMSLLNLALQNVSLCRSLMSPDKEMKYKRNMSLTKLRNAAEKDESFKEAISQSVEGVKNCIMERFSRLVRKEEAVNVYKAADKTEMEAALMCLSVILKDGPIDLKCLPKLITL